MRVPVLLLMIAVSAHSCALHAAAQSLPAPLAACGDDRISFDVSRGEVKDQTQAPEPRKALLFIIEFYGLGDNGRINHPVLKHGLDGQWIGATQGFTYLSTSVAPGEHHLCSTWQSHGALWRNVSLYNFHAESGKRYYVRAQIDDKGFYVDLQPVSQDEGRFLVSEAARSVSKPKR